MCRPRCYKRIMNANKNSSGRTRKGSANSICVHGASRPQGIMSPKDRWKSCNGRKIVAGRKILEVHLDKGMKDGQKVVLRDEGHQEPGLEPGTLSLWQNGKTMLFSLNRKTSSS